MNTAKPLLLSFGRHTFVSGLAWFCVPDSQENPNRDKHSSPLPKAFRDRETKRFVATLLETTQAKAAIEDAAYGQIGLVTETGDDGSVPESRTKKPVYHGTYSLALTVRSEATERLKHRTGGGFPQENGISFHAAFIAEDGVTACFVSCIGSLIVPETENFTGDFAGSIDEVKRLLSIALRLYPDVPVFAPKAWGIRGSLEPDFVLKPASGYRIKRTGEGKRRLTVLLAVLILASVLAIGFFGVKAYKAYVATEKEKQLPPPPTLPAYADSRDFINACRHGVTETEHVFLPGWSFKKAVCDAKAVTFFWEALPVKAGPSKTASIVKKKKGMTVSQQETMRAFHPDAKFSVAGKNNKNTGETVSSDDSSGNASAKKAGFPHATGATAVVSRPSLSLKKPVLSQLPARNPERLAGIKRFLEAAGIAHSVKTSTVTVAKDDSNVSPVSGPAGKKPETVELLRHEIVTESAFTPWETASSIAVDGFYVTSVELTVPKGKTLWRTKGILYER